MPHETGTAFVEVAIKAMAKLNCLIRSHRRMNGARLVPLLSVLLAATTAVKGDTTPRDIDHRYKMACADNGLPKIKCNNAWQAFRHAFAGKDWNASEVSDYDHYFKVLPYPPNYKNSALFWTGAPVLEAALSVQAGLYGSSNIIPNTIVDTMQSRYGVTAWCGRPEGGIDYTSTNCPGYLIHTPSYTFYQAFSTHFAEKAAGTVFFLTGNTFRNTSMFALFELPTLLKNKSVTKIVVLNVFSEDTCDQLPLTGIRDKVLRAIPRKRYECTFIEGDVRQDPPSSELLDELTTVVKLQQRKARFVDKRMCFMR